MENEPIQSEPSRRATCAYMVLTWGVALLVIWWAAHARGEGGFSVTRGESSGFTVERVETQKAEPAKPSGKPVIELAVSPTHCPPCDRAKVELSKWDKCPYEIRYTVGGAESYPFVRWTVKGRSWSYSGWHGVEHLKAEFEKSAGVVRSSPRWPSMAGYRARWSYPGEIRFHLRATHGVSDSLTREQAEFIHDSLHEGWSLQRLRERYQVK